MEKANVGAHTGISSILGTLHATIGTILKPIVKQFKSSPDSDFLQPVFFKTIEIYSISNSQIHQAFEKVAILSINDLENSYKEIRTFFFSIPISKDTPLSSTKLPATHWISRIGEQNHNTIIFRAILFYAVEKYVAELICLILKYAKPNTAGFLLTEYYSKLLSMMTNPNANGMLMNITKIYEKIIARISINSPSISWKYLTDTLSGKLSGNLQQTFFFRSFRSFSVADVTVEEIESIDSINAFTKVLSIFASPQSLSSQNIAAALFYSSLLAGLLSRKDFKKPPQLLKLIFSASTTNQRNPATFPLIATFFALSDDGRVTSTITQLMTTAKKTARATPQSEALILYGLKRLLCGPNYATAVTEMETNINLTWRMDKRDKGELGSFFQVMASFVTFKDSRDELIGFLIQLAANNIFGFIEQYIPDMQKSDFMRENGSALFEVCRILISDKGAEVFGPQSVGDLKKRLIELCTFFINEFGSTQMMNAIPGIPQELCDLGNLFDTSAPIPAVTYTQKRMSQDIAKLQKAVAPTDKAPFSFDPKVDLLLSTDVRMPDSPLARCLSLVPLLGFNESLTTFIVSRVYDESAFISSIASRALMLIAKNNPEKVNHILGILLSKAPDTFERFYLMVVVMKMVFSVLTDPKVIENATEAVMPTIINGLCAPSYEIRAATVDLAEMTPMKAFFVKYDSTITQQTLTKIASVFVSDYDAGALQQLSLQPFRDFAATKYEIIYHIYLSVMFTILNKSEYNTLLQGVGPIVNAEFTKLAEICSNQSSRGMPLFAVNVASFLVATADSSSSEAVKKVISAIIPIMISRVEKEPYAVVIYSFAATVNQDHALLMMKLLTGPNELYLRAFAFVAHLFVQNYNIVGDPTQLNSILDMMEIVVQYCGSTNIVQTKSIEPVKQLSPLMTECLTSLMHVIEILCRQFATAHTAAPVGPFLHNAPPNESINRSNWFHFMFNLASLDSTHPLKLRSAAKGAFASFCRVNSIPDEMFSSLIEHVMAFASENTDACAHILSHAFGFFLQHFIDHSATDPYFFAAIASQFPDTSSIFDDTQNLASVALRPMSALDRDFTNTLYSHLGDLLALCFLFLSGEKKGAEVEAIKVLHHLTISGSLIFPKYNFDTALSLLAPEELVAPSFTGLLALSSALAEAFECCAEQFIARSLTILADNKYTAFACLIEPWYRRIDMAQGSTLIVPGTQPAFNSYTPLSFLEVFTRVLCMEPLQPHVISLVDAIARTDDAVENMFCFCTSAYISMRVPCTYLLLHLCRTHPDLSMKAAAFLQARYWFYSVIQLRTFDRFFDFDRFLSEMKPDGGSCMDPAKKAEAAPHEETIYFMLDVVLELVPDYPQLLPYVTAFCLTRPKDNASVASAALLRCIGIESPTIADLKSILGDKLPVFFNEVFTWAVVCGDTDIAANAAYYAVQTVANPSPDMIIPALRAISITVLSLRENSVSAVDEKRQKKHLAKLLQGDAEVNTKLFYRHIAYLIDLTSSIAAKCGVVTPEMLSAILSFTSCGDSEFQPIFESSINGGLLVATNTKLKESIQDNQIQDGGILLKIATYNMLIDKKRAKSVIANLFQLSAVLFESGLYSLLIPREAEFTDLSDPSGKIAVSQEMQVAASILFLLPYIANGCSESLYKIIEKRAHGIIGVDISPIWKSFKQKTIGFFEPEVSFAVTRLIQISGPVLSSAMIKNFSLILNHTSKYAFIIYSISGFALPLEQNGNLSLRRIAVAALKDKSGANTEALVRFLPPYQKSNSFNALPPMTPGVAFPVAHAAPSLEHWDADEHPDLFKTPKDIPPLYPTECCFFYFTVIEELRNECNDVHVAPFDAWSQILFNMESARVAQGGMIESEVEVLAEGVAKMVNRRPRVEQKSSVVTKSLPASGSVSLKLEKSESSLQMNVPASVFAPTLDEIDLIGNEFPGFPSLSLNQK